MRERQVTPTPLDDSRFVDQQRERFVEEVLRDTLGDESRSHFTVFRPDLGMTYGGLHESREEAEVARDSLIREAESTRYHSRVPKEEVPFLRQRAVEGWRGAEVIELHVAGWNPFRRRNKYEPWGTLRRPYTHGVDDGTHGASLADPRDKRFLGV